MSKQMAGLRTLQEMKEFAALSATAQRYIRRALDVAFDRQQLMADAAPPAEPGRPSLAQRRAYARLGVVRQSLPTAPGAEQADFVGALVQISSFDLGQGQLDGFPAYRFLYERLFGAAIRPWLPMAFCGAASLPHIAPSQRAALLKSITEAAATASAWSEREPMFFPDWISGDDLAPA